MKQNTGKNSAVSTSVKKHFSPHAAVSSLNTTLAHSVAASEAEGLCCRRHKPREVLPHAGISKHQGDGMSVPWGEAGTALCSQLLVWVVLSKCSAGTDTKFCCAATPTALPALKTEWRKWFWAFRGWKQLSYFVIFSYSLFHLFLQLSSCPRRSDVSQVCIFSF